MFGLEINSYLKTMGAGTQNFIKIFLMFPCRALTSKYQDVWSLAEAPAVGSGAPQTEFITEGCEPSNSSNNLCAVGSIC